jgi:hypothetical protein
MAAIINPITDEPHDELLIVRAADEGFSLVQHETENGQIVFAWRRGTEPRPQFVSRRVALRWMHDWLGMQHDPTPGEDAPDPS